MKKVLIGITIIIMLISVVFGITKEEASIARTCTSDGVTKIFDKFSNTDQTGYVINPFTREVTQFICKGGKWLNTLEYAEMNKINIEDIVLNTDKQPDVIDEMGRDIIYAANPVIIADQNKQVVIGETIYNVQYTPVIVERIKCICEKACTISECVNQ